MNPTITLAGQPYEIPPLAIKQNRHIEPLAAKHIDYFADISKQGGTVRLLDISEQQAEDFTKIVYHALTRARPDLTYAQFEDMPVSMKDIMLALPVCLNQSGLFKPATEAAPATGEAPAIDWDALIAEFSYSLAQPWEQVENTLTMTMIHAYRAYWRASPPTHLLVAAYMGYKPAAKHSSLPPPPDLPELEE